METYIDDFQKSLYISVIQNLAFHLPRVCILGTHHCGNTCDEAFKNCRWFKYLLCNRYFSEREVIIFAHQIQYECYGIKVSVSIEGIALEQFSTTAQP